MKLRGMLLQACYIYLPSLQTLFAPAALDARAWLCAMSAGAIVLSDIAGHMDHEAVLKVSELISDFI